MKIKDLAQYIGEHQPIRVIDICSLDIYRIIFEGCLVDISKELANKKVFEMHSGLKNKDDYIESILVIYYKS